MTSDVKEDKKLKRCKDKVERLKKEIIELKDANEDLLSQLKGAKFSTDEEQSSLKVDKVILEKEALQREVDLCKTLASMTQNKALKAYISEVQMLLSRSDLPFVSSEVADLRAAFLNAKELVPMRGFHEKAGFAVGGGFSSGKSSFINSFIAEDGVKLETGLTPMTSLPTYIDFSDTNVVELFDATSKKVSVDIDVYKQLNHDQSPSISALQKSISRVLIETKTKQTSHPSFYFIDTPGYDPAHSDSTANDEKKSRYALSQADAVIWLIGLDANGTIPKSDLSFLSRNLLASHKLMLVLTKSDLKTSADIQAIMNRVKVDLNNAQIQFEGIQSLSQHGEQDVFHEGCTLAEFFKQVSNDIEKPSLLEANAMISNVFQRCINRVSASIQSYETLRKALKNVQIAQFKNDIENELVDDGLQEISKKIKSEKSSLNLLKSLAKELKVFFSNHCHYKFDMELLWPSQTHQKNISTNLVDDGLKSSSRTESAIAASTANTLTFSDERVSLTRAIQEIAVFHPEFSAHTAASVNRILRQHGILQLVQNKTAVTEKAAKYGITSVLRTDTKGEEYNAILYDKNAKLFVLGLLRDSVSF
ncbi:dynamin family protein [Paraferrimonas sp. SM1919]|uniref:dynamin family protein n=1 Tax=Paraferrimonas sp. SM1919 TaxID=2662263 RepID=UPI0013D75B32|nr:dynamin family protein [Paraferrimonas sp. SM1919]